MFNIFKRSSLQLSTYFADKAKIETTFEDGIVTSMFIFLAPKDAAKFNSNMLVSGFITDFMSIIEQRIKKKDFINTRPSYLDDLAPYPTINEDIEKTERIVATTDMKVLFHYRKDKS